MGSLIGFRTLQGIGGGGLVPLALTVIADVSEPKDRPRMLGYVSAVWGASAVLGPLLGSVLVDGPGWPFVFWVNVPVGLVAMAIVVAVLHDQPSRHTGPAIDWRASFCLVVGVAAIMIVLVQFAVLTTSVAVGCLALGTLALTGFAWFERRSPAPLLAVHLLRRQVISTSIMSAFLCGALLLGTTAFLPVWVQRVANGSARDAGVVVGVLTFSWTIANLCMGRLMGRLSYRPIAIVASIVLVLGFAGLWLLDAGDSRVRLNGYSAMIGIGLGVNTLVFTLAVQSDVGRKERGRATALFFFSRITGQTLGAACFGGILNATLVQTGARLHLVDAALSQSAAGSPLADRQGDAGALAGGLHHVFGLACAIALGMLLVAVAVPSGQRLKVDPAEP